MLGAGYVSGSNGCEGMCTNVHTVMKRWKFVKQKNYEQGEKMSDDEDRGFAPIVAIFIALVLGTVICLFSVLYFLY